MIIFLPVGDGDGPGCLGYLFGIIFGPAILIWIITTLAGC